MKHNNKYLSLVGVLATVGLTGCPEAPPEGFPQPENTVVVNFTIDASGRADYYEDGDLEWKGMFTYDEATRILSFNADFGNNGAGPYPPLYDDGPWTEGGHEPRNGVAGDDKFGVATFFVKPTEAVSMEYGAQTCCGSTGGWIWTGATNGSLEITPTSTEVTAEGMTLPAEGTTDIRLTLDTGNLGSGQVFATPVTVKGTFTDWATTPLFDDGTHGDATSGDGVYTYTLSADATRRLKPASGTNAEFIFVFGTDDEYKTEGGAGEQTGVVGYTKGASDANFVEQPLILVGNDDNTAIAIP